MKPTTTTGVSATRVTPGLMRAISPMDIAITAMPVTMSLNQRMNSGISITSLRKRLTASPGESGRGAAPGRRRMCFIRFLRSRSAISEKMGTSA